MKIKLWDFAIRMMLYTIFTTISCTAFFGLLSVAFDNTYAGFSMGVAVGFVIGVGLSLVALVDNVFEMGVICGR
jgi:ABC-type nitrate/sulfonate/bicarbonate transport system permease component